MERDCRCTRHRLLQLLLQLQLLRAVSGETEGNQPTVGNSWELSAEPVLSAGPNGTFDEVAVKDPSVVFFDGLWHVFFTARGNAAACSTGYVSAPTLAELRSAPRHELRAIKGKATGD